MQKKVLFCEPAVHLGGGGGGSGPSSQWFTSLFFFVVAKIQVIFLNNPALAAQQETKLCQIVNSGLMGQSIGPEEKQNKIRQFTFS